MLIFLLIKILINKGFLQFNNNLYNKLKYILMEKSVIIVISHFVFWK